MKTSTFLTIIAWLTIGIAVIILFTGKAFSNTLGNWFNLSDTMIYTYSEVVVFVDPKTKCEYLVLEDSHQLVPRGNTYCFPIDRE